MRYGVNLASDLLSDIKKSLPVLPGIMGRDEYFQSAVLLPLFKERNEWRLLFQIRASGIRQENEICFPGGAFEPGQDKNFRDTALRETSEELGLPESRISLTGPMNILLTPMEVLIEPYIGSLDITSVDDLALNPREVADVFTLPLSRLKEMKPEEYYIRLESHAFTLNPDSGRAEYHLPVKELDLPEKYHQSWGGRKHRILVYRTANGVIWGLTARILTDFIRILKSCSGT